MVCLILLVSFETEKKGDNNDPDKPEVATVLKRAII